MTNYEQLLAKARDYRHRAEDVAINQPTLAAAYAGLAQYYLMEATEYRLYNVGCSDDPN